MTLLNIFTGSHLWQSTLFAAVCWLAARLLQRNRAAIRYWVWLAASAKFLLPFSLLVSLGTYAGEFTKARVIPAEWPLAQAAVAPAVSSVERIAAYTSAPPIAPVAGAGEARNILLAVWLAGSAVVAIWGIYRWRRLAARIGRVTPLTEGRERQALRRVQQAHGLTHRLKLAATASSIEPGVRGILRPVLLLPAGIADRLTDAQLEMILLHELFHIRRRDNLAAALHLVVQTVFWFHPLVWWIGTQLVDERERSCDEDVLRNGGDPRVYASAILRVCEFYLAAPFAVVSRVTGSNLKTRIEDIMTSRIVLEMSSGRKLLLAGAAVAIMAAPVLLGMTAAAPNALAGRAVENETARGRESLVALRPAAISPAPVAISQARTSAQVAPAANPVVTVTTTVEPRPDYRLRPGDELDILVWKEPELTRRAVVRTDGKIGIPLVGDVPAEDYTPAALSRVIRDQLRTYLTDPVVSVIVVAARKSFVTIQGSVARPGQYPLDGRGTVLQLIAQAGGLSEFARPDRITIFREEAGAVRQHIFNYAAFIAGVNLDQNLELKEDDIVIVP